MENDGNYPWTVTGSHQNKDGKEEGANMQQGGWIAEKLRVGQVMWDVCREQGRGGGSQRMWVTATAPTSSHNETLFFCLAGHFL